LFRGSLPAVVHQHDRGHGGGVARLVPHVLPAEAEGLLSLSSRVVVPFAVGPPVLFRVRGRTVQFDEHPVFPVEPVTEALTAVGLGVGRLAR
jgi:hypothetical protein